jgi:hypothetical protein
MHHGSESWEMHIKFMAEDLKERRYIGELGVCVRIILKCIFNKQDVRV